MIVISHFIFQINLYLYEVYSKKSKVTNTDVHGLYKVEPEYMFLFRKDFVVK